MIPVELDIFSLNPEDPESNELRLSTACHADCKVPFGDFSIKYVVQGAEQYRFDRQTLCITEGSYLITHGQRTAQVSIDSPKPVQGMCIDLSAELLEEVVQYWDKDLRDSWAAVCREPWPLLCRSAHTPLGQSLGQMAAGLTPDKALIQSDFFYQTAEALILEQTAAAHQWKRLPAARTATQHALYTKLLEAKDFLQRHCHRKIHMQDVAKVCGLSEYHFMRLFRQAFECSPYQYLLQQRLRLAQHCLRDTQNLTDIAEACGFADIYAFSKAYKKHFGHPPSQDRQRLLTRMTG